MFEAQYTFADCQGFLVKLLGQFVFFPNCIEKAQIVQSAGSLRVLSPQSLLCDCQGTLVVLLGQFVLPLSLVEFSLVVENTSCVRMLRSRNLLTKRETAL